MWDSCRRWFQDWQRWTIPSWRVEWGPVEVLVCDSVITSKWILQVKKINEIMKVLPMQLLLDSWLEFLMLSKLTKYLMFFGLNFRIDSFFIQNLMLEMMSNIDHVLSMVLLNLDPEFENLHPILQAASWLTTSLPCCLTFNFIALFSRRVPDLLFFIFWFSTSPPCYSGGLPTCNFLTLFSFSYFTLLLDFQSLRLIAWLLIS